MYCRDGLFDTRTKNISNRFSYDILYNRTYHRSAAIVEVSFRSSEKMEHLESPLAQLGACGAGVTFGPPTG